MTLVERLLEDARQMRATGLVKEGAMPLAEEAAARISELEARVKTLMVEAFIAGFEHNADGCHGGLEAEFKAKVTSAGKEYADKILAARALATGEKP